jgi:hypothetical protein
MTGVMGRIRFLILFVAASASAACVQDPVTDQVILKDEWREALGDTVRDIVTATQQAYETGECETAGAASWLPESAPLVYFAAQDQLIRLETEDQIVAYCNRLSTGRGSTHEDIQEQTVHVLSPDAAYVVTRSVQTTQWQDGRTDVRPWLETAVLARQGGSWRLMYKHLSWGEPAPAGQR